MAAKPIRLLTNTATFPLIYAFAGRSVMSGEDLTGRMPYTSYGDKANADYGVPQLIFCENVLPMARGLYTVGYTAQAPAISPATMICDQAIALRDAAENQYTFVPARGANYVFNPNTLTWASASPFTFAGNFVTRAYVNGRTFVCYEKNRVIEYNVGTGLFTTLTLTLPSGVLITDIRGVANASNYLLLFTDITIYWCSPLNLLDFATIDQGAGQQTPIDIKGQITAVLPCAGGFIIYTTKNAVGATFTNNGNAPFVYKEINNCGGVASWERVTPEADDTGHYIWGTNGLQKSSLSGATNFAPEATDFLVGGEYEAWDATLKQVTLQASGTAFSVKVAFCAGRYLIVSYSSGTSTYTRALVYDTTLQRWGKLAITHVDVFMYTYPVGTIAYNYDTLPGYWDDFADDTYDSWGIIRLNIAPAKQGVAFLGADGSIQVMTSDFAETAVPGVAIFGHIQQQHSRLVTLLAVDLEGLRSTVTPTVTALMSVNGYARDSAVTMGRVAVQGDFASYQAKESGKNCDIAIEGTFALTTVLARVMNNGYR